MEIAMTSLTHVGGNAALNVSHIAHSSVPRAIQFDFPRSFTLLRSHFPDLTNQLLAQASSESLGFFALCKIQPIARWLGRLQQNRRRRRWCSHVAFARGCRTSGLQSDESLCRPIINRCLPARPAVSAKGRITDSVLLVARFPPASLGTPRFESQAGASQKVAAVLRWIRSPSLFCSMSIRSANTSQIAFLSRSSFNATLLLAQRRTSPWLEHDPGRRQIVRDPTKLRHHHTLVHPHEAFIRAVIHPVEAIETSTSATVVRKSKVTHCSKIEPGEGVDRGLLRIGAVHSLVRLFKVIGKLVWQRLCRRCRWSRRVTGLCNAASSRMFSPEELDQARVTLSYIVLACARFLQAIDCVCDHTLEIASRVSSHDPSCSCFV